MRCSHQHVLLALTAAWLALACGTATANVIVFESTVSGILKGQDLADDRKLEIPSGSYLLVLASQDSKLKQIQISGPRVGKVRDLLSAEPIPQRLYAAITRLSQSGGADQRGTAASRGFPVVVGDVGVEPDAGTICVPEGALPSVGLADGTGTTVKISDQQGTRSASLEISGGGASTWPENVPIRDGARYRIIPNNSPQVGIRLRVVPSEALSDVSSVRSLQALEERGCRQQVDAALKKIVAH